MYRFYNDLLGTRVERTQSIDWNNLQLCRIEDNDLDMPFTEEEVEHTIKMLPVEKAPGPDGFTGIFYKK